MNCKNLFIAVIILMTTASCMHNSRSMREPNVRLNLERKDFTLSGQVSGEATQIKVFGIDWERVFLRETGSASGMGTAKMIIESIPVIGNVLSNKAQAYALHDMMEKNPGYDVVLYPQFETTRVWFPFFFSKTKVKSTARLGKLNQ
jgi:hypothetical protein